MPAQPAPAQSSPVTFNVILLAAGKGTRMYSDRAKVLHEAAGLPLVAWMHRIAGDAGAGQVVVVVGYQADEVAAALPPGTPAHQAEQLGTGHAAAVGLERLDPCDVVVVLPGDMPLIRPETIASLVAGHVASGAAATVLSVDLADPTGYGRVVLTPPGGHRHHRARRCHRRAAGHHRGEHLGVRLRPGGARQGVGGTHRPQRPGERYLTDVIGVLVGDDRVVGAVAAEPVEGAGVARTTSSPPLQPSCDVASTRRGWPPGCSWRTRHGCRSANVELAPDVRLWGDVHLMGTTTVASGAELGPSVHIADTTIGEGPGCGSPRCAARRSAATPRSARSSASARTVLEESSKAGTFVEIKGSVVGQAPDAAPLVRRGDATIGADSNIGAGTITANYDGKHKTVIGDGGEDRLGHGVGGAGRGRRRGVDRCRIGDHQRRRPRRSRRHPLAAARGAGLRSAAQGQSRRGGRD